MDEVIVKRNIKASLFTDLFGTRENLLKLYRVFHPEDTEATVDDLENITINNVMVNDLYNDLGFQVRNRLIVLVEAQSTWSENIVIRALLYLAETWQKWFDDQGQDLYGSKRVDIPEPELYVVYTGDRKEHPETIRLSEAFFGGKETAVDVTVKMLYGSGQGDILDQYVTFTKIFDEQRRLLGRTREAILETIQICKDRNVLKEYLSSHEQEVVSIMLTLYDEKQIMKNHDAAIRQQGLAALVKTLKSMIQSPSEILEVVRKNEIYSNVTMEQIMNCLG